MTGKLSIPYGSTLHPVASYYKAGITMGSVLEVSSRRQHESQDKNLNPLLFAHTFEWWMHFRQILPKDSARAVNFIAGIVEKGGEAQISGEILIYNIICHPDFDPTAHDGLLFTLKSQCVSDALKSRYSQIPVISNTKVCSAIAQGKQWPLRLIEFSRCVYGDPFALTNTSSANKHPRIS